MLPMRPLALVAGATLALSSLAHAQQPAPELHMQIFGGASEPLGHTSNYFQGGVAFGAGFSYTPVPRGPLDLRFDFAYAEHNASNQLIALGQQQTSVQVDGGTGAFWSVTGNLVYHVPLGPFARAYGIAGVGVYHARVELTQSLFVSGAYYSPYYCDPFYYYCDYAAANIVASHDVTKFGWNAGVGVEFPLYRGSAWFIEARYHRIDTNRPIEYVPIQVGYRF